MTNDEAWEVLLWHLLRNVILLELLWNLCLFFWTGITRGFYSSAINRPVAGIVVGILLTGIFVVLDERREKKGKE